jgi:TonB family protein
MAQEKYSGAVGVGSMQSAKFLDDKLTVVSAEVPQDIARKAAAGSSVTLIVYVDQTGKVTKGSVQAGDAALASQIVSAAQSWMFSKPTVNKKPVTTIVQVVVHF